ncbi:MAG: hypothetical protein ACREJC_04090, partial [Tepidisphaeraceae bacterium]
MNFEPLEPRRMLAGVTLLTHGFLGNINGWVKSVADGIVTRAGGRQSASQYVMRVDRNSAGSLAVTSFTLERGSSDARTTRAAEIIIKLDWSRVSGGSVSTTQVGNVVGDFLRRGNSLTPTLTSVPLQLIGHSRGASLNVAISQYLGRLGIFVEQNTFLDPVPLNSFPFDFGDAAMNVFDNVAFSDNYWRSNGNPISVEPNGRSVNGTYQGNLNQTVQVVNSGSPHNSVPAYYFGTINYTATTDGVATIFPSWYGINNDRPPRDRTGYLFSRIMNGTRPANGVGIAYGGTARRVGAGQSSAGQWPNLTDLSVLEGSSISAGQNITLRFLRQDRDSTASYEFFLDNDQNPFNNTNASVFKLTGRTFSQADAITATRLAARTVGAAPGTYFVYCKTADPGGRIRFAYSTRTLTLRTPTSGQLFASLSAGKVTA